MKINHSGKQVRDFIMQEVGENPGSISHIVSEKFGISRQAVNRHMLKLISDRLITAEGNTKSRRYYLRPTK